MADPQQKTSPYLQAGSPVRCALSSCAKPFLGRCVRANNGRFYCSHECAEEGERANVTQFKRRNQ